ncbi:hypothetical protein [Curtobacterium sp. RRHDQ10]|uniref:hypothetical protein n=1 Tax=Curtobacterium phyllosphaerae TaxID=3413379 RepID=UPI003BF3525B
MRETGSRSTAGWRAPVRWARTGRWLLLPYAVLVWSTLVPQVVSVLAFAVAVLGLLGVAAAATVGMLARGRVATGVLGAVLVVVGVALFGLDPIPGSVGGLGDWWPEAITQPQVVGSAYWTVAALGVVLTGGGMLVTLFVTALFASGRQRTH